MINKKNASIRTNLTMAVQHVLTMCPGTIAVPLVLGNALGLDSETMAGLLAANLFASGVAILIQVYGIGRNIGSRMPLVLGSSFAPLGAMVMVGKQYGLQTLFGAVIVSGVLMILVSFCLKWILKFFPPMVIGSYITVLGISLIPSAFEDFAGGKGTRAFGTMNSIMLGVIVILIILGVNYFGKGMVKSIALLIGLLAGTVIAIPMGMFSARQVSAAAAFELIKPMKFGIPQFRADAIFLLTIFCAIGMIQCVGVYALYDEACGCRTDEKTKINGMRGIAVAQIFSGMFNSLPFAMFNENIAVLKLSGNREKASVGYAGMMLVAAGLCPKLSAFITSIPKPVIGGATLVLFGTIAVSGVSMLGTACRDNQENSLLIGIGLAIGLGVVCTENVFAGFPAVASMLLGDGLFMVTVVMILMSLLMNKKQTK